jgi:hypothetical protein
MYVARRSILPILITGMLLAACGAPAATGPTPDVNGTVQAGAQTMVASVFQTQTAAAPTVTDTAIPTPTATTGPTNTALALPSPFASATQGAILFFASPTPTGTFYTSTPLSSSLAVGCNNLRLIRSFTEPEGPFDRGEAFTQYWQVENNGTCNWVYVYELVFSGGNRMSGSNQRLSKVIEPGKWTTLSVELEAPNGNGTHTASWRFTDGGGTSFGATLPVSIRVDSSYP